MVKDNLKMISYKYIKEYSKYNINAFPLTFIFLDLISIIYNNYLM